MPSSLPNAPPSTIAAPAPDIPAVHTPSNSLSCERAPTITSAKFWSYFSCEDCENSCNISEAAPLTVEVLATFFAPSISVPDRPLSLRTPAASATRWRMVALAACCTTSVASFSAASTTALPNILPVAPRKIEIDLAPTGPSISAAFNPPASNDCTCASSICACRKPATIASSSLAPFFLAASKAALKCRCCDSVYPDAPKIAVPITGPVRTAGAKYSPVSARVSIGLVTA